MKNSCTILGKRESYHLMYYQYTGRIVDHVTASYTTTDNEIIEDIYCKNIKKLHGYPIYDSLVKEKVYIVDWQKDSSIIVLDKLVREASQEGFTIIIYNDFKPIYYKPVEPIRDEIDIRRLYLSNIIFMKQFTIRNFDFDGSIYLNNNLFFGKFALYLNNITGSLFFLKNTFGDIFYLNNNSIDKVVLGDISFTSKNILKDYNKFIHNIKDSKKNDLKHFRESCNFIKHHYTGQNNYIDSNVFYTLEMLARGKELEKITSLEDCFNSLVFIVSKLISNHGQSISKPFFIILGLALCWGVGFKNIDYFFSIALPITDLIKMDIYKEINNHTLCFGIPAKPVYIFIKVFSAMLWWHLIRAIRKDIKR